MLTASPADTRAVARVGQPAGGERGRLVLTLTWKPWVSRKELAPGEPALFTYSPRAGSDCKEGVSGLQGNLLGTFPV